ncbi:MAG: hypothetical protein ABI576_09000 [Flavobacterium sp.]
MSLFTRPNKLTIANRMLFGLSVSFMGKNVEVSLLKKYKGTNSKKLSNK